MTRFAVRPGPLPATWGLIAVLVAVHVVTAAAWHAQSDATWVESLFLDRGTGFRVAVGGQHRLALLRGEWWRLATSVLLHADALHLTLNAVAIGVLGRILEPNLGAARTLGWFVLGGVVGSLGSHALGVLQSDGASAGAFALLAAAVWLGFRRRDAWAPDDRVLVGPVLGGFLLLNLVLGCVIPSIDGVGHAFGGAVGAVLAAIDPAREGPGWRVAYVGVVLAFAGVCAVGWAA